jgi:hypothetical protein
MNTEPVVAVDKQDIPMSEFRANLPNATSAFDVKYIENKEDSTTFEQFYTDVYEYRNSKADGDPYPYTYGSY